MNLKSENCKFCDSRAHEEWGETAHEGYLIECSNSINCKQWPRIYGNTRTHTIRMWNKVMKNDI